MKIGLQVPRFTNTKGPAGIGSGLIDVAQAAEAAGFYSLWVMDHFFQIGSARPPEMDMLEAYTTLGFCAAATKRIKLGALATGVVYRHPGILVKTVTTLDVLSGGRAYFAVGAAWYEREAKGLGAPFPPLGTRFEMLEETIQIAKQMWSGTVAPYHGKHFHLEETLCRPLPLTRPHPPIMVAGAGEKKTLFLAAKYGDACNVYGAGDAVAHKFEVLKRHCETLGRDYGSIEKTAINGMPSGPLPVKDIIAQCRALADIGADQAMFSFPGLDEIAALTVFGKEIIPAVAEF
jgi:F420-dependent oxidoreductase-like protein